ncbi:MAG: GtrA family protein [Bacteroidia bacterium]
MFQRLWQKAIVPKLKFAASSGLATSVDYGVFFSLTAMGIAPGAAQLVAAFCGMVINFFLQKRFIFKLEGRTSDVFILSMMVSLGGILLSGLYIWGLVQFPFFAKNLLVAKLLVTGTIFLYNFYLKKWVFGSSEQILKKLRDIDTWISRYRRWLLASLAALAFIGGLWIVPDFGVGWDEKVQREHGLVSAQYIDQQLGGAIGWEDLDKDELNAYFYRAYGVFFQVTSFSIETMLGIHEDDARGQFLLRHYLTYIVFCIGVWCMFVLGKRRLNDWKMGVLAALLLILSPRLFPHFFTNPKDTITLAWYLLSILSLDLMIEKPSLKRAIFHAFACALLMNARPIGLIIPTATLILLLLQHRRTLGKTLLLFFSFSFAWVLFTIAMWPYLWENTWEHFSYAFTQMKRYNWNGQVLFEGSFIKPDDLPWYYAPKYMLMSIPLVYTVMMLVGIVLGSVGSIRNLFRPTWTSAVRLDLICLGLGLGPLLAVWLLDSILYDGWRQLFFIYPPLLLLAVGGFHRWRSYCKKRIEQAAFRMGYAAAWGMMALGLVSSLVYIIQAHPNQQAYFNAFASSKPKLQYEMDYWGLSFKQGWERIAEAHPEDTVTVCVAPYLPGLYNYEFALDTTTRQHILITGDLKKADYFMSIARFEGDFSAYKKQQAPYSPDRLWFVLGQKESPVLSVYKTE